MTVQQVLDNIESYPQPVQEAIQATLSAHQGEMLKTILSGVVGEEITECDQTTSSILPYPS